jgi:hypothetical protein
VANDLKTFVLVQLSDLHCSDGHLQLDKPSHKHDENLLVGVQPIVLNVYGSITAR